MKILGINDDKNFCECCGKTGLKRVVWIEKNDGEIVHYGTTCATKKHLHMTLKEIKECIEDNKNLVIRQIRQKVRGSSEYNNWLNKYHEARRLGLRPLKFIEHHRKERIILDEFVQNLINETEYKNEIYIAKVLNGI